MAAYFFFLCNIDLESLMDRSDHLNNKKLEKLGKQTVAMSINGKRAVQMINMIYNEIICLIPFQTYFTYHTNIF